MYERILVPLDGSETSKHGLDEAIRLATLSKGHLQVFHALGDMPLSHSMDAYQSHGGRWADAMREYGSRVLEDAVEKARSAGVEAEAVLRSGAPGSMAEMVVEQARSWPADIIILGTHGRSGVKRMLLGSGAEAVIRSAPVPVLLVRLPDAAAG